MKEVLACEIISNLSIKNLTRSDGGKVMEEGCNFDEIFNIFFKFVANRFIKGRVFEEGESIFLFSSSWMQMDKLDKWIKWINEGSVGVRGNFDRIFQLKIF